MYWAEKNEIQPRSKIVLLVQISRAGLDLIRSKIQSGLVLLSPKSDQAHFATSTNNEGYIDQRKLIRTTRYKQSYAIMYHYFIITIYKSHTNYIL